MPLLNCVEFTGIHADPSLATEGTAFPNSTSALMTGRLKHVGFRAAGAAALIPSFAREGSGSSGRSFKGIYLGHAAQAQADSRRDGKPLRLIPAGRAYDFCESVSPNSPSQPPGLTVLLPA